MDNYLRIGKISSVNTADNTARVIFPSYTDENSNPLVSGELKILQRETSAVEVDDSTLTLPDGYNEKHNHFAQVGKWVPKVDQTVLCIFMPEFNGDGFILGGL